ncbi:hypothetical protein N7470_003165 [Penicillium chermesinum]|nr:hypothetical protein N7470_003165 [Penicillium chermesinum]
MTYYRSLSPSNSRHQSGPRASTGTVQLGSSYDHYDPHRSRYESDGYTSNTGYPSSYRYPPRRSPVEARPVISQKIQNPASGAKKRTEYTIQPQSRHRSNTTSGMEYDNPPRLAVPSSHLRPVISSSHGSIASPVAPDSGQYLVPYNPHSRHRRVYSTDYASDTGRYGAHGSKHRSSGHGSYHVHAQNPRRHHTGWSKGEDIDSYDAYSYTTPREQFDRDYPVKPRRTGRTSLDRPLSMTVMDEDPRFSGSVSRGRHHGPPPTSWGLDKLDSLDREGRPRSARPEDQHRSGSKSRAHDRALVALSHGSEDEYDSYSDGHRRRHRRRRSHRDGDDHHREHRSSRSHNTENDLALAGLGAGLGTAALAGYSDMSDYDYPGVRRHHRRPRDDERDYHPSGSTDYHDRRSRSRRRSRHRPTGSSGGFTDDEDLREYKRQPSADPRYRHSSTDTSEDERPSGRHHRARSHRSSSRRLPDDRSYHSSSSRQSLPHDSKDDLKTPITVEPAAPKAPEAPPKGILKTPRASFPEEKNPVREGVAPLKDATKKGIPPGARWTKIDRRLVNPEALEKGNERYEERPEYVIVLRVLSKEEIQAYAVKTQEIRDARHKDQTRDRRRRIEASQRDRPGEMTSSDDEEERDEKHRQEQPQPQPQPQPRLEAPPAPPSNQTSLPFHTRAANPLVQGTEGLRPTPSMAQV